MKKYRLKILLSLAYFLSLYGHSTLLSTGQQNELRTSQKIVPDYFQKGNNLDGDYDRNRDNLTKAIRKFDKAALRLQYNPRPGKTVVKDVDSHPPKSSNFTISIPFKQQEP